MANLRDKGYPSAKTERVNRSNKQNLLMKDDKPITVTKALQTETREIPSKHEEMVNRLVTAYNNRAFANPNAPLVGNINSDNGDVRQRGYNLTSRNNERLGMVSRTDTPTGTAYHAALDNGNENRGTLDATLNTPYGRFGGGYEQDTNYVYAESPNEERGFNFWYGNDNIEPIEVNGGIGTSDVTGGDMFYVDTNYPFTRDRYNSFDTPIGTFDLFTSAKSPFNEGYGSVDFTPANYIQALMNLMNRGR